MARPEAAHGLGAVPLHLLRVGEGRGPDLEVEERKLSADSSEPSQPEQGNSIFFSFLEEEEEEEFFSSSASAAEEDEEAEEGGSTQTFSRNQAVPRSHAEGSTCATRTRLSLPIGLRTRRA